MSFGSLPDGHREGFQTFRAISSHEAPKIPRAKMTDFPQGGKEHHQIAWQGRTAAVPAVPKVLPGRGTPVPSAPIHVPAWPVSEDELSGSVLLSAGVDCLYRYGEPFL
jgi:hypothetical protein